MSLLAKTYNSKKTYMKKLIVSDYDQTFYLNDENIEINKVAVEEFRDKGNIFAFATGRSYADFKKKSNLYNLKYDYLIINHGATILDKNDNVILNYSIDNNIVSQIINDLDLKNTKTNFFCNLENSRANKNDKNLTKIYSAYNESEKLKAINELINKKYSKYVNCYCISGNTIEIISSKTNKSHAINEILKRENIKIENVYTVGDGYSDIKMIKNYNGYCMENSVKELLDLCKDKKVKSVSELISRI